MINLLEVNKQQGQLMEMFKMQAELDKEILSKKRITEYPFFRVKNALRNELQELNQWLEEAWKYWKVHARWYLKDDESYKEALEEYVDCLHFALSLTLYFHDNDLKSIETMYVKDRYYDSKECYYGFTISNDYDYLDLEDVAKKILIFIEEIGRFELPLLELFRFGHYLGFTWEEIYDCYKMKNAKNYQRQKENY